MPSITSSPTIIPPNHPFWAVRVYITGTGTSFDGTTVWTISSVAGATLTDQGVTDGTHAWVDILTEGVTDNTTLTITETITGSTTVDITIKGIMPSPLFLANSIFNQDISAAPLHPQNDLWMDETNGHTGHQLKEEFGTPYLGRIQGIPINVIYGSDVAATTVDITSYASQSDSPPGGIFKIPEWVVIESDLQDGPEYTDQTGADCHCLIYDAESGILHEFYHLVRDGGGTWDGTYTARQYSYWDATTYNLRTNGWTSTDAAGLPVAPLMFTYKDIQDNLGGDLGHAIRCTIELSSKSFLWPARHYAGSGGPSNPPMGMRIRLLSSFDISPFTSDLQVILRTLKKYGMIFADNGTDYGIQADPDPRWNDANMQAMRTITISGAFEVVDTSNWQITANSHEANPANPIRDIRIKDEIDYNVTLSGGFASELGGPSSNAHNSLFYYAYADASGNTYVKYLFTGLTSGKTYRIAYMWPQNPFSTFATNAPWYIYASDGTTVLSSGTLDFTQAPGDFTDTQTGYTGDYLDDVVCDGTELTIEINGNANSYVIADAVWVEGLAPAATIVCSLPT